MIRSALSLCALLGVMGLVSGCSLQAVKPWERAALARPDMAWEPDPLLSSYRRHTQVSKEAASGGTALAGGGCGCN